MQKAVFVAIALLAAFASGQQDVLIHEGRVDFIAAEYFLDTMIVVNVLNCPPRDRVTYQTTDNGQTWEGSGTGGSSDTTLTKAFSSAADGDNSYYYMLCDSEEEGP